AGREHREIALRKAFPRALVDAVERIDEAVAEGIGVHVERRMDEVADIGPVGLVTTSELDRGAEALGLYAHPELADPVRSQFARAAFEMHEPLELVERD